MSIIAPQERQFEVVERKGIGHPDTIADALAENLSIAYSKYTLAKYGGILHHNFDKLAVLGGETDVDFGKGVIIKPIRVLLNGRASTSYAGERIDVRNILIDESRLYFNQLFSKDLPFNVHENITFQYNISDVSGPGKTRQSRGSRAHLFKPRDIKDVKGYDFLANNDTSIGCGYAPLSELEKAVLFIERKLNHFKTKKRFPWLGSDIKVMGIKNRNMLEFTICIPQIADRVPSILEYKSNLTIIHDFIKREVVEFISGKKEIKIYLNTRDDYRKGDVYLTAIGSSIESGDEGIVGRGNRVNGLITPLRPMNLEGVCGKNPKYYTGKLYNVAANILAKKIFEETKKPVEVILVSQNGRELTDPWGTFIKISGNKINNSVKRKLVMLVKAGVSSIPSITERIVNNKIQLY